MPYNSFTFNNPHCSVLPSHSDILSIKVNFQLGIMLQSSTPNGLAPLSHQGLLIFALTLSSVALLWGITCLVMLLRQFSGGAAGQEFAEGNQKIIFSQLCNKVLRVALQFLKYNYTVCLVAGVIFFLIIFGAIQNFDAADFSLVYLYGVLESTVVGLVVAIVAQLGVSRVGRAALNSLQETDWIARLTSSFVAYFVCGLSSLVITLIIVLPQEERAVVDEQEVKYISKKIIAFAFGVSTVAIGTKINSVIYGKGSEAGLALMGEQQPDLVRNHCNSAVICRAVGQNIRKVVSNAIDYNMYLCLSIACGIGSAGVNVIGADQEGQIIFSLSNCNLYLPLLATLFMLTLSLIVNAIFSLMVSSDSGAEIALNAKRQIYLLLVLMSGFLALAAYLTLPVQFFIVEMPNQLKAPYLAYLCMLIALFAMFALLLVSELQVNHPKSIYSMIWAGGQSEAAGILAGLQLGWLGSVIPVLVWAGLTYLAQYWLGSLGVSLVGVGTALLIPNYLGLNTYYSLMENSSFLVWVGQLGEQSMSNIMNINQGRKIFEVQVNSHYTSVCLTINYALILNYINVYDLIHIPLNNSGIFIGLILGAMLIYSFGSVILLSIHNVTPILGLDIRAQMEENPNIKEQPELMDSLRSNTVFCVNTILQLKFFLPYLFLPFLLVGLAFGPKTTLGMVTGMLIGGLQLAFSSGLSGSIWNASREELFLGKVMSEEGEYLRPEGLEGRSVALANEVGMQLKDAIGSCVHGYITFTVLTNAVMAQLYNQLHA